MSESEDDAFFFDSLEWEKEWKKSLPRLNDKELLEIFPISKEALREKIEEQQAEYDALAEEIKRKIASFPIETEWFSDIIIEHLEIPRLLEKARHISRLKRQLSMLGGSTSRAPHRWQNMQELIVFAKTRPISELARSRLELRPSGKNFVALCPFHNEKTPSCYFYTETNTFYCFGCHEKGDIITFYMHLYGVSFTEAVKMLT